MNETMNRKNDMKPLLQDYIQRLANPDRVGCPTFQMLEAFLYGQLNHDVAADLCDHLPRCRECLLELRSLRDIMREGIQDIEAVGHEHPAWDKLEAALASSDKGVRI